MSKIVQPRISPDVVTAREIMSTPVVTISEDVSIDEAVRLMSKKNVKKLPVVTDHKLVGIITSLDLVREEPKLIKLMEDLLKGL